MRLIACLLLSLIPGFAQAAIDLHDGALYRTQGVPAWNASTGTFTIMLWVLGAPDIAGTSDYFNADDGTIPGVNVNVGSAADDPTGPYFWTLSGEWHFNKDGTYTANPATSFDVTQGWTFLAVSFTTDGRTDLYAWQEGVNADQLVHIPSQDRYSSVGGTATTNTLYIGNRATFDEGCMCWLGPIYVYDGIAMTQAQIDAQRRSLEPLTREGLVVYSHFSDARALTIDQSGTADWQVHGTVRYSDRNPPVPGVGVPGGSGGSAGPPATPGTPSADDRARLGGSGGPLHPLALLLLGAAWMLRAAPQSKNPARAGFRTD